MRRQRSGRDHLSDIFYTIGDMNLSSVDNSFGFSREFTDATQDRLLREERLQRQHRMEEERQHRMEEERRREAQYPSCRITDRPPGWHPDRDRPDQWYADRNRPPRDYYDRDRSQGYYDRDRPRGDYDRDRPPRW